MALNSSGEFLFATLTATEEGKGKIAIIDPKQFGPGINPVIIDTDAGVEGITATDDPTVMLFTNRKVEAQGLGRLIWSQGEEPKRDYVPMLLGSTNDAFDVNEAVDVIWLRDQQTGNGYAFVAGRNGRLFGSGIPSIDGKDAGSNVGIVQFAQGSSPKLIAATTPIPMGLTSSLKLSSDNRYLYVAEPGVASTFIYDVLEILKTLDGADADKLKELAKKPIDSINPNIGVATNLNGSFLNSPIFDTIKDRPIGAGASSGLALHQSSQLLVTGDGTTLPDGFSGPMLPLPAHEQPLREIRFDWSLYDNTNKNLAQQLLGYVALGGLVSLVETKTLPEETLVETPKQVKTPVRNKAGLLLTIGAGIAAVIDGFNREPLPEPTPDPEATRLRQKTEVKEIQLFVSVNPPGEGLVPKDWRPNDTCRFEDFNECAGIKGLAVKG